MSKPYRFAVKDRVVLREDNKHRGVIVHVANGYDLGIIYTVQWDKSAGQYLYLEETLIKESDIGLPTENSSFYPKNGT